MAFWSKKKSRVSGPARLPSFVRNINSATRLFCPYGTELKVGDRAIAWDEKTVFGREQRQRQVEITDVKIFRTNGRVITLDFVVASDAEVERIAADSEIAPQALFTHRSGKSTYDMKNPPMVLYFRPLEENQSILGLVPDLDITRARGSSIPAYRREGRRSGFMAWLRNLGRKSSPKSKYD